VLVSDIEFEEEISEEPTLQPAPTANEVTFAKQPFRPEEVIYVDDIKAVKEKSGKHTDSPVLARSSEIHTEHPSKWKGAMFLASVCAIAISFVASSIQEGVGASGGHPNSLGRPWFVETLKRLNVKRFHPPTRGQ